MHTNGSRTGGSAKPDPFLRCLINFERTVRLGILLPSVQSKLKHSKCIVPS